MPNDQGNGGRTGPERRRGERRVADQERREEIRFEPTKNIRRKGRDRRKTSGWDGTPVR